MIMLERSVTHLHWENPYRFLARRHREGWSRKAATIRGHTVWMVQGMGLGHRVYYAIFDKAPKGERPIAWLILKQRPGWWAWEVEQLMVFPQFRRQGLASKLYKAVINHDRCMLASGKTHTSHSKAMWESFIRQDLFNVWAHDFSDLQNFYQVCWDKESQEVVSQLSLYSPTYTRDKISKNNVRLVAMRKG